MIDEKALRILFDTYWSSNGWKNKYATPPDDLSYAKASGYMFDPVEFTHDDIVDWLLVAFSQVTQERIAAAFLSSLTTRRLERRSALASFAVARHFPKHRFTQAEGQCEICGLYGGKSKEDLNVLNFKRFKWGGVRHLDPLYIAFDLEQFSKVEFVTPSLEDREIFKNILSIAQQSPPHFSPNDLEKALVGVFNANKDERRNLIEVLSICGILRAGERPGFYDSFVTEEGRELPSSSKNDWEYPSCWWRGKDGVHQLTVHHYFPALKNTKNIPLA